MEKPYRTEKKKKKTRKKAKRSGKADQYNKQTRSLMSLPAKESGACSRRFWVMITMWFRLGLDLGSCM